MYTAVLLELVCLLIISDASSSFMELWENIIFDWEGSESSVMIVFQNEDFLLKTSAITRRVIPANPIPTIAPVTTSIGWWK